MCTVPLILVFAENSTPPILVVTLFGILIEITIIRQNITIIVLSSSVDYTFIILEWTKLVCTPALGVYL